MAKSKPKPVKVEPPRRHIRFEINESVHARWRMLRAMREKDNEALLEEMIPVFEQYLKATNMAESGLKKRP